MRRLNSILQHNQAAVKTQNLYQKWALVLSSNLSVIMRKNLLERRCQMRYIFPLPKKWQILWNSVEFLVGVNRILSICSIIQKSKMKAVRSSLIENIRNIPARSKHSLPKTCPKTLPLTQPLPAVAFRSTAVEWLYRAQRNLQFSRSTLFLALGLLDKLLQQGLVLTQENFELVAGSILLASTKFNEVYPVTVRKLNVLSEEEHSLQQFVDAEAAILQNIEFTVTLDPAYEELCELETEYEGTTAENVQELVKMAVVYRNQTFKHGLSSLIAAIKSLAEEGGLCERSNNSSGNETQEIKKELTRLRSTSQKRLVSPGRA